MAYPIGADDICGQWVDSLGNDVSVTYTDKFQTKMVATLSRPPRPDIHLTVKPVFFSGWHCGNAVLHAMWSTPQQLCWLTGDGRVSVWVKPPSKEDGPGQEDDRTLLAAPADRPAAEAGAEPSK